MSEVVKDDVVTVEIEYGEEYGESPLRERRTYFLFYTHTKSYYIYICKQHIFDHTLYILLTHLLKTTGCTHRPTSERESEKSREFFREERDEFAGEQESSDRIW